jgi:hypothetical protein
MQWKSDNISQLFSVHHLAYNDDPPMFTVINGWAGSGYVAEVLKVCERCRVA